MNQLKKLTVEVLGTPVGVLAPSAEKPKYVFSYLPDAPATHFVSLSMPVRPESYEWPEGLHPVFQMNLPEGYQKDLLRQKLGRSMPVDDFSLLALTGGRGIGRVSIYPWGQQRPNTQALPLVEVLAHPDSRAALLAALDEHIVNEPGFESISGVMPKVSGLRTLATDEKLTVTADEWILKTGREDTPGIAINEYLCLELARAMGLPVPRTQLSADGDVLAVARFDRDSDGSPLGLEDFCALMGMPPHDKYSATMEGIAKHLHMWCADSERISSARRLVEMVVLNLVVRNADAHAKNFAVLYSSVEDATLAPVFDVVTVAAYREFAQSPFGLSIGGRRAWNLGKELERLCVERLNLPVSVVSDALEKAAAGMQRLAPEIARYAHDYPHFRRAGKRMVKLWEEGLRTASGGKGVSVVVDFSAAKFSDEATPKKSRKSKRIMNPEKLE
jgi:serine/threonine-protein kinase HipA